MKQRLLFFIACLLAATSISAVEISEAEAIKKAKVLMPTKKFLTDLDFRARKQLPMREQSLKQPPFYIINTEGDNGFAIVAADDRVQDILGYSEHGSLELSTAPCNVRWWLEYCETAITKMIENNENSFVSNVPKSLSNANEDIEPFIQTTWGQGSPYNSLCPKFGQQCVTGCVATAMAQVINYCKWPEDETTSVDAYSTTKNNIFMPELNPTSFDWYFMDNDDIARLMLYCGQSVRMDYGIEASGAFEEDVPDAMKDVFGYDNDLRLVRRSAFTDSDWDNMIYQELQEKRPVLYSGGTETERHMFVVNGYKNGMYYVNWGWDGECDGYFSLSFLSPDNYNFTQSQSAIVGIQKPSAEEDDDYFSDIFWDDNGDNCEAYLKNNCGIIYFSRDYSYGDYAKRLEIVGSYGVKGEVTIPQRIGQYKVIGIGPYAFNRMESMTKIFLPDTLEFIQKEAFSTCIGLTEIKMPEELGEIYNEAFKNCIALEKVRITAGFVNWNAFEWCTKLKEVILSPNVDELRYSFTQCANIKRLIIEDGPGEIKLGYGGDDPIHDKKGLFYASKLDSIYVGKAYDCDVKPFSGSYKIVLGPKVTAIPPYFFSNHNVGVYSIPLAVTKIGKYAFENASITELHLTSSIQDIGEYAFKGCRDLRELDLSVCSPTINIGEQAFNNCADLITVILNHEMPEVPNRFLRGCSALTTIQIPTSVTRIGTEAFSNCVSLESVQIPTSVTIIDNDAFRSCTSLRSVNLPPSLQHLGAAFRNSGLEEITIPETITSLNNTFENCQNLRKVILPNTCQEFGAYTFQNCPKLEEINIPEGVTVLSPKLFSGCSSLRQLNLPSTITSIGYGAFYSCTNLEPIFQTNNVIHVGDSAFAYCSALEKINSKLYVDGTRVFKGCINLKEIELWGGKNLDGTFTDCSSLSFIRIPANVEKVTNRCFAGCTKLKSIVFEEGSELCTVNTSSEIFASCPIDTFSIGRPFKIIDQFNQGLFSGRNISKVSLFGQMKEMPNSFFKRCSIRSLLLGDSLSLIGGRSLVSTSIDSIYSQSIQPPTFPRVSYNDNSEYTRLDSLNLYETLKEIFVKVTSGSGSLYRNAAYWKNNLIIDDSDTICTVNVKNPGTLIASMKQQGITEPLTTLRLKILGTLNQSDWNVLKNDLALISYLDISQVVGDTIPPTIFSNHFRLVDLVLPYSTTRIGDYAFKGCKFLRGDFSLPNCQIIGAGAFQNTSLQSICCKNAHIKEGAFKDCVYLTHVDIMGDECQIDSAAFYNCSMLSILNMPTAKKIGSYAFYNCLSLDSISIIGKECMIGNYAFAESGLKCASLGDGIKSIGRYSFSNCSSLESIALPSNLSRLSEGMFANCVKLRRFEFPSSIQEIGSLTFSGCSIDSLDIPIQVICMDGALKNSEIKHLRTHWQVPLPVSVDTFTGLNEDECTLSVPANSAVNYLTNDPWKVFWKIEEVESEIVHKLSFDDINVKTICLNNWDINGDSELGEDEVLRIRDISNIFANSNITSFDELQYFNGLRRLNAGIFNNCENLKRITIPKSIEELESQAFYGCKSLESIEVHPLNPYFDSRDNCNAIVRSEDNELIVGCKKTTISSTINGIGDFAFCSAGTINRIDIPSSIVKIGNSVFTGCTIDTMSINNSSFLINIGNVVKHFILGDNITMIPSSSFEGYDKLLSIQFPETLTEIKSNAFAGCCNLLSVPFPEALNIIQSGAFCNCEKLETITLPNCITSIAPHTFNGCTNLHSIDIPGNVTNIGEYAFYNCSSLEQITLPSSLKTIGNSAFYHSGLTSIEFPEGLIDIGTKAFFCELKTVSIPSSVTNISGAFTLGLKDLYLNWDDPTTGYLGWLLDYYKTINLHVPYGKKLAYQQDNVWKNCLHIWEPVIMGDINDDGVINVSDMMGLIYYILDYTTYYALLVADLRYDAADINNDGKYRVDDLTDLLTMILDEEPANGVKPYMANSMLEEDKVWIDSLFNVSASDNNISMCFTNDSSAYSGVQFDIYLPDGYEISDIDLSQNTLSHEAHWKKRSDGSFRVIIYSMKNSNLAHDGLKILIENQESDQVLVENGYIKNIVLSTSEAISHYVSDISILINANPSNITSTSTVESNNIYIYDLNGKVVARFSSMDKITNLPKGVYIVNGRKYINH